MTDKKVKAAFSSGRLPSLFVWRSFLFFDDQCHEDEVFRGRWILDAVLFAVWAEGCRARTELDLLSIVVVDGTAGQDVIGLGIALVRMGTDGAKRRNDDFCIHVTLAVKLAVAKEFDDGEEVLICELSMR